MALPKSGKSGSNVLKLEDVRNKHKKSKRSNQRQSQSSNEDEAHVSADSFETDAREKTDEVSVKLCTVSTPDVENTGPEVIKTPAKRSLVSNRRFDKVKVERIKAEIANGDYKINYLRVADRFIEHERFG